MYPKRTHIALTGSRLRESHQKASTRSCLELTLIYAKARLAITAETSAGSLGCTPLRLNAFACHQTFVKCKIRYTDTVEYLPGTQTNVFWTLVAIPSYRSFNRMFDGLYIRACDSWPSFLEHLPLGSTQFLEMLGDPDDSTIPEVVSVLKTYETTVIRGNAAKHAENQQVRKSKSHKPL